MAKRRRSFKRRAAPARVKYKTRTVKVRSRSRRSGSSSGLIKYVKPFGVGAVSGVIDNMAINPLVNMLPTGLYLPQNLAQAGVALAIKHFLKFNPAGLTEEYVKGKLFMAGSSGIGVLTNNSSGGGW